VESGRTLYRVYVDESGDRGAPGKSQPFFILSAVAVRDEYEHQVRDARRQLCETLEKPITTTLHWSENMKRHEQRKVAAQTLGKLPVRLLYVIVDKKSLGSAHVLGDREAMYNYAVRRLLERLSWLIDDNDGEAILTFAHVKHFPYDRLYNYVELLKAQPTQIRWNAFRGKVRIVTPDQREMLQFADIAAGCLQAAIRPDRYGNVEEAYITAVRNVIYNRGLMSDYRSYGLNVVGDKRFLEDYEWWSLFKR
jgi:hypothetical protein